MQSYLTNFGFMNFMSFKLPLSLSILSRVNINKVKFEKYPGTLTVASKNSCQITTWPILYRLKANDYKDKYRKCYPYL
jgi:hypothetical protein